jgi:hypothetical protein
MSSSDYLSDSDADYKEDPSDYVTNSILGRKDVEKSISDQNNIENSISDTINHITPGIDTVPTKDNEITAQRIDETNEHLYKISEKLDIIIDLLGEIKNNSSSP